MAKPRITFAIERSKSGGLGELQIYLNPEGRDLLVEELTGLNERWDHIHLQDENWTVDVPLRTRAYHLEREEIIDCVKILFRPDDWDAKYFPHVLIDESKS